jgi:hypothetical protein
MEREVVVSVSGGVASSVSAILAKEAGYRAHYVFADTTIEDPDLYRHLDDLEKVLEAPIIRLKDGRDPWEVFVDVRYIGNSRTAHCSRILKTDQVAKWIAENAPDAELVLGMYLDEQDRLERAAANWHPVPVTSLLMEFRVFPGKADEILCKHGLSKPHLYELGFPHNNCGGMCVRAGQGQFATLLDRKPEFYRQQEDRQEWAMEQIGPTARGFIRVQRNGKTSYLTMRQFREAVESGELKPDLYEMGGCGCFVDDERMAA